MGETTANKVVMENVERNGDGHHGFFAKIAVNTRESREKQNLAHL